MIYIQGSRNVEVVKFFVWLTTVGFLVLVYIYSIYTAVQLCRNNNATSVALDVKVEQMDAYKTLGKRSLPFPNKTYTILWHNSPSYFLKNTNISLHRCLFNNCRITTNTEKMSESDVVIFRHNYLPDMPPLKGQDQIWVLFSMESPFYIRRQYQRQEWHNKFNWSITYTKEDSDIQMTYASIVKSNHFIWKNYSEIFRKKTKDVAWIVSHCYAISDRDDYVNELRKYISVDIYGKCGNFRCSKKGTVCIDTITSNYKFYLSFENSLCKDYVTEKVFWMYNNKYNIIPVIRSALNVDEYIPSRTSVNVYDFNDPKSLANYLHNLGLDESEYITFLREKDKYKPYFASYYRAMCSMCEKLNTYSISKVLNVDNWFSISTNCLIPQNGSQAQSIAPDEDQVPDYWYWD